MHSDLQTCDHVVCNRSSIVTRVNTEQTQTTEGHCLGNALKSLQQEAAEKAHAVPASCKAPLSRQPLST